MKKPRSRAVLLALAVCGLAVIAGVLAVRAFAAGTEEYCAQCTLPSSGVPAVSSVRFTFDANSINTVHQDDMQIFNYNANLNVVSCPKAGWNTTQVINNPCSPTTSKADARCHLLDGTGPDTAVCEAHYTGG